MTRCHAPVPEGGPFRGVHHTTPWITFPDEGHGAARRGNIVLFEKHPLGE